MAVYVVTFGASNWFLYGESVSVLPLLSQCFNDLLILVIHFVFVNLAVRFYRQYVRLGKALKALDQSKAELQKAYDDLAEVTLLEERQRIAKAISYTHLDVYKRQYLNFFHILSLKYVLRRVSCGVHIFILI